VLTVKQMKTSLVGFGILVPRKAKQEDLQKLLMDNPKVPIIISIPDLDPIDTSAEESSSGKLGGGDSVVITSGGGEEKDISGLALVMPVAIAPYGHESGDGDGDGGSGSGSSSDPVEAVVDVASPGSSSSDLKRSSKAEAPSISLASLPSGGSGDGGSSSSSDPVEAVTAAAVVDVASPGSSSSDLKRSSKAVAASPSVRKRSSRAAESPSGRDRKRSSKAAVSAFVASFAGKVMNISASVGAVIASVDDAPLSESAQDVAMVSSVTAPGIPSAPSSSGKIVACLVCSSAESLSTCSSCTESFCEEHVVCHGWIISCDNKDLQRDASKTLNALVISGTSKYI